MSEEVEKMRLGRWAALGGGEGSGLLAIPTHHLVTHGVVVGMTGSGKTGLVSVLAEEALGAGVPTILIDVKGDLGNLLLTFRDSSVETMGTWLAERDDDPPEVLAERAAKRREALAASGLGDAEQTRFVEGTSLRLLTPGSNAGEPLHVLSGLERRSSRWDDDPEAARDTLHASISLLLRLLGRESDPAKSREHVLLSVLAERRLAAGKDAPIAALMEEVLEPPLDRIGALPVNAFLKKTERVALAAALNSLLASPRFLRWRTGASLDVAEWVKPVEGRTPGVILSVAHLEEAERHLVLGLVLEEILSWVRGLRGTSELRALVVFDEIYGFLPPHPANPPTKRPLVALMKQARAYGVGVVVATQNPMDLDYRALSNAGLWCIGRLQTDADRARVVDGLSGTDLGASSAELHRTLGRLAPRWFVVRNSHAAQAGNVLLRPRHALSLLRGPMTRPELAEAQRQRTAAERAEPTPTGAPEAPEESSPFHEVIAPGETPPAPAVVAASTAPPVSVALQEASLAPKPRPKAPPKASPLVPTKAESDDVDAWDWSLPAGGLGR